MNKNASKIWLITFVAVAFLAGLVLYGVMPDRIASHWNVAGQVNGYLSRFWGLFLVPLIMGALFLLYWFLPKIDPLKNNIESFRKYYDRIWIIIFAFLLYVDFLQIVWNLGIRFNFGMALVPAFSLLWYGIGGLLEKTKRNWFIGIRTPWTLSSDIVWEKTHQLAGKLFIVMAIIAFLGIFFGDKAIVFAVLIPAVTTAVVSVAYSYFAFKKFGGEKTDLIKDKEDKKVENLGKVLEYFTSHQKVSNDDIEKLLGVSDATATNYLSELESRGKISQIGKDGRYVYYTFNG